MNEATVPNFWIVGLQMVAMLSVVLAVLFGVLFLTRRISGRIKGRDGLTIDILCARQMGPKKQVVLLEVLDQRILVGVGPDTITRLASFPAPPKTFAGELEKQMVREVCPETMEDMAIADQNTIETPKAAKDGAEGGP
ncbi:MAG: FliO/MopB family protein [Desulfatibacillum sp.]|nr:FliO/MopB family protein [Desulfatibacillum sp.]